MGIRIRSLKPSEDEIQGQIVQGLRALCFTVLVTTVRPKRCPQCQRWGKEGSGATKGIPDLFFSRQEWGNRLYGAEIKSATGRLRPEQKVLADRGMTFVWRSLEDALETLKKLSD